MTIWTPDNKVVESKFNMRQFKKASWKINKFVLY
jgi:hypothetical protein